MVNVSCLCNAFSYFSPLLVVFTLVRGDVANNTTFEDDDFPVPLHKQKEIFQVANKTPNNIEYIGSGYDMYSVDDVDEHSGFNLNNYRGPILDSYEITGNSPQTQFDELGIWVSNEFLCDISKEVTAIDNKQKLESIMESQTKENIPGIVNYAYVETNKRDEILNTLKRFRKVVIKKYKCTVYSAGLLTNNDRDNMTRFHGIVNDLVKACKGDFKEENCPIKKYTANMADEGCEECISPWMRFFYDFGTHITSRVTMGGVIRKFNRQGDQSTLRNESTRTDDKIDSYTWFGLGHSVNNVSKTTESSEDSSSQNQQILQYTVGPEPSDEALPPHVLEEWVHNVAYNPVPISTEFVSLYEFMPDENARSMYKEALRYYAKVKGVVYTEDSLSSQDSKKYLLNLMKNATVATLNGVSEISKEVCLGKSRILFGFGINLNSDKKILETKICYSGLNACILNSNKDVKSTFVLAYCSDSTDYEFSQKMVIGSSNGAEYTDVQCPRNSVIGLGVVIRFQDVISMTPCLKGNKSCGSRFLGTNGMIWIVCFPKNTFGFNLYSPFALKPNHGVPITCNKGQRVANGFSVFANSNDGVVRVEACEKARTSCHPALKAGDSAFTFVVCAH